MESRASTFRDRVIAIDRESAIPLDAQTLWRSLCAGTWLVCDSFSTQHRSYLVLAARPSSGLQRLTEGRLRGIVEGALSGTQYKVLSAELGVSQSTVANSFKHWLQGLGLDCLPSRLPVLLVLIAQAALDGKVVAQGVSASFEWDGLEVRVASVPRPEALLEGMLPRAEYESVRLLIAGETHRSIAAHRHRSPRTIANQIGAAFRRLGVSGRAHLLQRVVALRLAPRVPA